MLFLYDKLINFPIYILFIFIIFSHILDRIISEINRILPPHISFRTIMPGSDYIIVVMI